MSGVLTVGVLTAAISLLGFLLDAPCERVNNSYLSACSVFPISPPYRSTPVCRPGQRPTDRLAIYRVIATIRRFHMCAWCPLLTTRRSCYDSSDVTMQPCCSSAIRLTYIMPVTNPQSSFTICPEYKILTVICWSPLLEKILFICHRRCLFFAPLLHSIGSVFLSCVAFFKSQNYICIIGSQLQIMTFLHFLK